MSAKAKKDKKPRVAADPASKKEPLAPEGFDFRKETPAWRVHRLELCDPYGWHVADKSMLQSVQQRLANFETMTWMEILVRGHKFNHPIQVLALSKDARDRLAALGLDQIEELISLRVSATERIFGIRDGRILDLLWWDPEHRVCPSQKKHT